MHLFLDSSALAKRYILERGTDEVDQLCRQAESIVVSILCVPEVISAMNRLKREKKISSKTYQDLKVEFAADIGEANIVGFDPVIAERAIQCLEKSAIRTLDAIQIASCLEAGCDLFLTADLRQVKAAKQASLKVKLIG